MPVLPPVEVASLQTNHLIQPQAAGWQLPSFTLPNLSGSWELASRLAAPGIASIVFTIAAVVVLQPHAPQLSAAQRDEVASVLEQETNAPVAAIPAELVSADSAQPQATITPASTADASTARQYLYHASLAQGFLAKAVQVSQQTSQAGQTETDRQSILASLEQALQAVNQAIALDDTQGAGFLLRARIYKTASVIRPELAPYADKDLEVARSLGVDASLLAGNGDVLQLLPTEQATNLAGVPIIADVEEGQNTTVQTSAGTNSNAKQITMPSGWNTIFVSYPGLKANQTLRVDVVDPAQNRAHNTFTVTSREEGRGFTITSNAPVQQDVLLEWRAIE